MVFIFGISGTIIITYQLLVANRSEPQSGSTRLAPE